VEQEAAVDAIRLQTLLDAAQEDAAREDRQPALRHFREAIGFVCDRDKPRRPDGC